MTPPARDERDFHPRWTLHQDGTWSGHVTFPGFADNVKAMPVSEHEAEMARRSRVDHAEAERLHAELAALREAAQVVVDEGCREELGAPTFDKCWKPAEYVLWGKLIPPEGLGPRCYEHAAKHVGHHALAPGSNYALIDLRPLRAVLASADSEADR